ncbi:MAG TPA: ATP-binding protein [Kineosporiaceae bacterium]|nr:ATP-binding protein [Kineosporiaceae bacterium]
MNVGRKLRLLIVEQQQEDAERLVAELVRAGFEPDWLRVETPEDLIQGLYPAPNVILCDHGTPGLDAVEVLTTLRRHRVDSPLIVVSGQLDEEICVKTLRMGAADYLLKDRLARLGPAVEHALVTRRLEIEKREAERKERETASILRGLVAHAPAALSVKSVDGTYLLANRQFEVLRGVPTGTLIGRLDAEVFPVQQAREMTALDACCLRDLTVMEREEEIVEPSGKRNVLCIRYPVIDDTGEVFGIGAIYLDITRQKRVEAQLRTARAEMLSRAEMLGAGIEQLRELNRLKSQFVDAVSHELRTPLTSIRGYLELLRDDDVDLAEDLARRCLDVIDRNSEHLMGLVEDLLILSQVDSADIAPLTRPTKQVSIPEVVSSAVSILRPSVQQAGLSLSVRLDQVVPPVNGDRDQLERVVMNLLSNAVKFSPVDAAGAIEVSVFSQDDSVTVSVSDRGIGIGAQDRDQLFTRFFRSVAARDRGIPGSGLGLAVVKGIVDSHGGTISVASTPGRGTTMIVQLPATV